MEIETIRKIAREEGLANEDLFVEFFSKAFPNEDDRIRSYCAEWVDRFKSGNPMVYMDSTRINIFKEIMNKRCEKMTLCKIAQNGDDKNV